MAALVTMFIIAVVLWTLDLTNFIMEAKITLTEDSDETIDVKYGNALNFIFRLAAAQDALYAYMVSSQLLFLCRAFNSIPLYSPFSEMRSSSIEFG